MTHVHVAAARNISSAVDVQNRIYTDFKSAGQIALRFLTFFAVNSFSFASASALVVNILVKCCFVVSSPSQTS